MKEVESKKYGRSVVYMSILVAFFADIKCVNAFLVAVNPSFERSMMSILYAVTVFLLLFIGLKNVGYTGVNRHNILIPVYSLFLYFITTMFGFEPRVSFLIFGVFTISAYFIPLVSMIDTRLALKSMMFFSVFSILKLSSIFAFVYDYNDAISMGASYAYLVPVMATIVYLMYYYKHETLSQKRITLFLAICNVVFLLELVLFGSRGPLLAIAVFFILRFVVKFSGSIGVFVKTNRLLLGGLLLLLIVMSFTVFAEFIANTLESIGINSYSINKIINMADEGNLSNGRDSLSQMAIVGFGESPIWGHGLDLFGVNYVGASYPHNFFLQILYDGGLIFFFILIVPAIKRIRQWSKYCNYDQFVFFMFIFCVSVPGALFSGDLWENNLLWLMFGFLMNQNSICHSHEI